MAKVCMYLTAGIFSSQYVWKNVVSVHKVKGQSMYPALNSDIKRNDWVLLNERLSDNINKVQRGDVVVFRSIRDPMEFHIKRIIALEGDTVKTLSYRNEFIRVPAGHCWVEGDNHTVSEDSNKSGPLPLGLITAKATYVLHPNFRKISPKFVHDRVWMNPDVEKDILKYVNNLPPVAL